MRHKCIAKNCTTWRTDFGISEVVNHFRTVHGAQPAKIVLGRLLLEVKLFPNVEGAACIQFPNMVEYDGVHFLFTVIRFQNRHYFMFYFIEHEFLPENRQLDAELNLLPPKSSVPMKTSGNQTIIYPINAAIDNLIAEDSDKLHFVEDEEFLENYVLHNHYLLEFTLQELPKKSDFRFIKTLITSSSVSLGLSLKKATGRGDSGIKDNIESREDRNNRIEPIKDVGDFPLDEYVENENQPKSTASNSSFKVFEETQLQKEKNQIQPEKLDEHETPIDCMKNLSQELQAVSVHEKQSENVVEHQKNHEKKMLEIDGAIDSKGSSSESVVGKLVSLECPNCHYEICTLTTRAKLTVAPLLDREARKSVVFQQKKT